LVHARASTRPGRVREGCGDDGAVAGGAHARLPGSATARVCGGVHPPREGAQEAGRWGVRPRQGLPPAPPSPARAPTPPSYLTSRHPVVNHGNSGRANKRIADATPYPLPAGSRWLQDLGFLAFTLPQVAVIMPTQKPRGRTLPRAQKAANRRIARRRVRIE